MGKRGRRRRFGGAEKVAILKRHLIGGGVEVSAICEELKVHPNQFYEWQKLFFEKAVKALESEKRDEEANLRERVASLEEKLQRKDSVLSELMEEHVALKKSWGGLKPRWIELDLRDQVVAFVRHWHRARIFLLLHGAFVKSVKEARLLC